MTIRIGYIQWLRDNGFGLPDRADPEAAKNIVQMDAILPPPSLPQIRQDTYEIENLSRIGGVARAEPEPLARRGCHHRQPAVFGRE